MSTSTAAVTGGRYLLRRAWRIICSIRTTVVLLAAITLLSLLGTVFPQLTFEVHADPDAYGQWLAAAGERYRGLSQPLHRLGLFSTGQRNVALVLSLLTFCPPGPALRAKVNWNSRRGIFSRGLTTSIYGPPPNSSS